MWKPTRNSNIKTNILPDGYVLVQLSQSDWVYVLTPLAGIAWEFCDGENTLEDIIRNVVQIHPAQKKDDLAKEIASLLEEFRNADLVAA